MHLCCEGTNIHEKSKCIWSKNFIHLFTFCLSRIATNLYETQNIILCQIVKKQVKVTRIINLKKTHITSLYRKSVGSCKIHAKTFVQIYSVIFVWLCTITGDALLAVFALCEMNEERKKKTTTLIYKCSVSSPLKEMCMGWLN